MSLNSGKKEKRRKDCMKEKREMKERRSRNSERKSVSIIEEMIYQRERKWK